MKIPPPFAFGLYVACCLGFGQHKPDGLIAAVNDTTLEGWARWEGKRGVFATAFRTRCTGEDGIIRGWSRQRALLRKQASDAARPPSHLRNSPDIPPGEPARESRGNPRGNIAGDGGRRTEDGHGNESSPTSLPGRLAEKLIGHPSRYAITGLIDALPEGQNVDAWSGCLVGCLDGLGLQAGRVATVDELAAACTDYLGTPVASWGLPHFRSFVDRVVAKRFRPTRALPRDSKTERAIEAVARFAAKGDAE